MLALIEVLRSTLSPDCYGTTIRNALTSLGADAPCERRDYSHAGTPSQTRRGQTRRARGRKSVTMNRNSSRKGSPHVRVRGGCPGAFPGCALHRDPLGGAGRSPRGRDRQGRAGVRGVPARGALRLPGLRPRARHGDGQAHPAGRADVEQCARALRRAQAPVPAPLHRLPVARRGARDHSPQGAGGPREARARGGRGRAKDPRDGSAEAPVGLRVARLGAFARDPERAGALAGARRVHADDAGETREGSRAREGRPRQGPRRLIVDERILEFIGDLRRAEIRVSPSEALDALAASAEVGLADREAFKSTLAATLIKEFRDQPTFDRLFNLYFLDLEALGEGLKKALGPEDPRVQDLLDDLMADENMELDELTELLMRGQGSEMEMAIRSGGQNAGLERLMYFLQVGFFSRRISDKFDWSAIEGDLERIMKALEQRGLDPGQLARIRNYLELRLEAFKRMIRQHVERELERRAYRQGEKLTREVLSDKPLFALTPDEIAQMKNVVARLARRIKDALALRQRQEQRGRIDTRRTTRKSLQYGGVPMELYLKRRHREKPKLVTICDVSDSVRNASRFMLQLVWSLQECFSRVRSYVFVSEIAEVTQAFGTYPVERAIEWALKGAPVDYHCRSDFGYAFNRFAKTELESLDRKTTILILGDARNNYNDPQAWALRLIRERVKGIIWLNPEGQWGWGIGDSVMPLYTPACDFVRECRTIGQLGEVVDNLVHHWWRRGR